MIKTLDAIDDLTRTKPNLSNPLALIDVATENAVSAKLVDFRDLDLWKENIGLADWLFVRCIREPRSNVVAASRSYLKNKVMMNSAAFYNLDANYKYYQQITFFNNAILSEYTLPTYRVDNIDDVLRLLNHGILTLPLIIKPDLGSQNYGVKVIRSLGQLKSHKDFWQMIAQPFIECDREWRAYVIGGVNLNISYSPDTVGKGTVPKPREWLLEIDEKVIKKLRQISLAATSILRFEYSAVDIIRDKNTGKYYILEVNMHPAIIMTKFCENTGENIKQEVFDWFVERDKFIIQKLPLEQCLSEYLLPRLRRLSPEVCDQIRDVINRQVSSDLSESEIIKNYFNISIEEKLKFLYTELCQGREVKIKDIIMAEAGNSVSWAGNFLIDRNAEDYSGMSISHSLENGAVASVLYIAILTL